MRTPNRRTRRLIRALKSDPAPTPSRRKPVLSDALEYALGDVEAFGRLGPEGLDRYLAAVAAPKARNADLPPATEREGR